MEIRLFAAERLEIQIDFFMKEINISACKHYPGEWRCFQNRVRGRVFLSVCDLGMAPSLKVLHVAIYPGKVITASECKACTFILVSKDLEISLCMARPHYKIYIMRNAVFSLPRVGLKNACLIVDLIFGVISKSH